MIVSGTKAVASTVGTTSNADVVVMAYTSLVVQILPVSIRIVALIERILILSGILTHLRERRSVHHRILVEHLLEADIAVVCHLCGSALATLDSSDDDDTVGTTGTIDGRCGCILQDIHRLDVCGVDVGELSHERYTVEHYQRVVACAQRALTTDTDLHFCTRLRVCLSHEHTSHTTLESLSSIGSCNLVQFLTSDVSHRTRDSLTALSTITDDHHLIN